ncbi:MAG: PDZ domain-containing protein [Bacteroidales bacterium]|nr:PDZ domain-containing protein [Bacteroidales bacterium]
MPEIWHTAFGWIVHVAFAGGAVLLLGWFAVRCVREPAIRQLIAAWTVRGAVAVAGLCLLPGWWSIPGWNGMPIPGEGNPSVSVAVPLSPMELAHHPPRVPEGAPVPAHTAEASAGMEEPPTVMSGIEQTATEILRLDPVTTAVGSKSEPSVLSTVTIPESAPVGYRQEFLPLLLVPYVVVVCGLLGQLVLGHLTLAGMRRVARQAPAAAQRELAQLAEAGDRPVELRVQPRLSSPVCFGLFRWVILIPPSLAGSASTAELRWILAHELDHLRRGDPWTAVWAGVCRAVFFFVPWFWLLRRELYLNQEHLADAAAAAADGRIVDYAAFLVDLSGGPVARTSPSRLGANAARASHSDLFRRVTMLLNSGGHMNRRCPRRWTAIAISSIMLTSVVLSGITWTQANAEEDRPNRPTTDRREGDQTPPPRGEERGPRPPRGDFRPFDPAQLRKTLEQLEKATQKGDQEAVRKLMGELRRMMPPPPPSGERPRDGEGPRGAGPRDGEGPRGAGPRDGEGPRRPGPRDGEGPRRPGPRDGEGPRGERPAFPPFGPNPDMMQNLEKSLEKALDQLKDHSEAREQVQKALDQYRRTLEGMNRPPFGFGFPGRGGFSPMFPGREGPRFGMMLMPIPELVAEQLSLPKNSGMAVASVFPRSPADKAGLQKNDIVIRFAGQEVTTNLRELHEKMEQLRPGDTVEVVIIRKGKKETLKTTLPESRPNRERPQEDEKGREREKDRKHNRDRE